MITVSNVSYLYRGGSAIQMPDMRVSRHEHCLLLGSSGSGKTTLLHLIGGLLRGYEGSIQIDEAELRTLSESALDKFRGQHIGFIFQKNHLIAALTVEQNLLLAPFLAGVKPDRERIAHLLAVLDLESKRHARVNSLSHGQAQRVAIARAVLNKPTVLLADEPTSALDDANCDAVIHLLMEMADEHKAALLVATHDHRLKSVITKHVQL